MEDERVDELVKQNVEQRAAQLTIVDSTTPADAAKDPQALKAWMVSENYHPSPDRRARFIPFGMSDDQSVIVGNYGLPRPKRPKLIARLCREPGRAPAAAIGEQPALLLLIRQLELLSEDRRNRRRVKQATNEVLTNEGVGDACWQRNCGP